MHNRSKRLGEILAMFALLAAGCTQQPATPAEQPPQPAAPAAIKIGGEDVLTLARKASSGGSKPEFLSVTLLPGRGMNMLQVTAAIPGKGEIPLLHSPSVADAASQLTGTGKDQLGNASFSFGGAFLIPYPNRIIGEPSSDGKSVITQWRGHTLALPANFPSKQPGGRVVAIHGLITQAKVEDLQTQTTADGQTVTGVIHAGDFGGHWLSDTDLNLTIALTGDAVDATITARNVGKEPEPISIGWHPYFQIPSGHRAQVRLQIPASMMAVVNNYGDAFPTGQLKPVKGTEYDYNAPEGVALDDHFLDDNFSHLQRTQRRSRSEADRSGFELRADGGCTFSGDQDGAGVFPEKCFLCRHRRSVQLRGPIREAVEGHGYRHGDASPRTVSYLEGSVGVV